MAGNDQPGSSGLERGRNRARRDEVCGQSASRRPRTAPFHPLFFFRHELAIIRKLTELLLGDSNGAQEAAEWIDLCVWSSGGVRDAAAHMDPLYRALAVAYYGPGQYEKLQSADPAKICREGLQWMNGAATSQHSKQFAALETKEQIDLLETVSTVSADKRPFHAGARFFDYLKTETARSFYTSRMGLKELDYKGNAFYAQSPGCGSKRIGA